MAGGWMKIGFSMVDDVVDKADFTLPTEAPEFAETHPGAKDVYDAPQGRRSAPAKENIPRIVSTPE